MSPPEKHTADCMVCGTELVYDKEPETLACSYCGKKSETDTFCKAGHYVCDTCHSKDAVSIVKEVCLNSIEKDMIKLLEMMRSHPTFPMHGPEHHAMVAGVILAAYKNSGGVISDNMMIKGIERGGKVPGSYCGFLGACGAALGVGAAFAIILESTPLKPEQRQKVLNITSRVLQEIGKNRAARCCQRESVIALQTAAKLSTEHLDVKLTAGDDFRCAQYEKNKECIKSECPFWLNR